MNQYKSLIKNSFLFAIGNIGSKAIQFFMLPLYTRMLTRNHPSWRLEKNERNGKIRVEDMKKKKVYSSDLKLLLVKEYLNSEKSLKEFSKVVLCC